MTRRRWLLVALAVLVVAVGATYLLNNLERYKETVDQGPSPEARTNPWLAAESFLRSRSIDVKIADSTNKLPDASLESQTLLLLDHRENMTPSQADKILQWARSGGHVLFVAEQLWNEKKGRSGDLLLDRLQIHQLLTKDLKAQDYSPVSPVSPVIPLRTPVLTAPKLPWPDLTRLYLENEEAPAYIGFDPRFHLEDPEDKAQSWANSAGATHMLQLIYGDGLITVVTDSNLWKSRSIGHYDNAWLLWYLTQDSRVTMVIKTQHDNLFSLLLRHFPLMLLMLALLISAGLWRGGMRQGPVAAPVAGARRQLAEHLRASAEFLRRRNGQQTLLRSLQAEILRRARIRHPGFETLMVADQWQVLARLTRQPTSVISQALRPRPVQRMSGSDFTLQVAHLQTIRNAL